MAYNLTKYDIEFLFKEFGNYLENKSRETDLIPAGIFSSDLSPFESVVKYLHENNGRPFSEIGRLLNKDRRVIWITYSRASKKCPSHFSLETHEINIPVSKLCSETLSMAEIIVSVLKEDYSLKNKQISLLLKKDVRTIWTLYKRAILKRGVRK